MNKKMLGAILGGFAFSAVSVTAHAGDEPAKKEAKKPADKGAKGDKKGGEKSCGADGKGCNGEKK